VLEVEYSKNPNWSTVDITALAKRLDLGRTKVYKWSWDRKKKIEPEPRTTQDEQPITNNEPQSP
jgi:hypothetical protein